ncbi:MAG: PAS domain S-box protein [Burkholderiaceae bacterium]|nr:MAG: PAS domain S-box protein [Burkholderiaceae bacterium]
MPDNPVAPTSMTPAGPPLRVLMIEDSETDYELILIDLRRDGSKIESVRIEEEGPFLSTLRSQRWDVILSDHNLPRFSSRRALELLMQEQRDIPFLIVSGTIGEDHAVDAMLAGADDYVMKGSTRRLRPAIDRAIKAAEHRQQQRHAEQALQDSLERLETLVAASPLAIVVVDESHRVSVWNQTAERMLGIPAALAQGQVLEHAREPLLREINLFYRQLRIGQHLVNFSALLERPDGSLVDISVTAAPLHRDESGESVGMVAFIADVTEQRRLEQARQENEIKLSAITSNLPGVVFQILFHLGERSVMVPYVSEGAHQLFGISADEFSKQPFTLTSLLSPTDREQFRETLAQAAASGDTFRWQGRIFPAGQHARWLYFAASPRPLVMDYTVWDGIIIDITQQKSAEEWLQASQDELRALSAHMEQVKETERADIAREIHDDLGGTMTKLKADVLRLRKRLASLTKEIDPAAGNELETTLVDMQGLLDHAVASTSRIARSLRPAILDLGIVPALEWEIGEFRRRTSLRVNFTCNLEELELGKQAATVIYRVVQEALTNILKHAQAKRVDVELFATDDRITLEIHDNGIGIDAKSLTKPNSFGIRGMTERARILAGWMDVSSAPGKGTTLMLSIPRMMDNPSSELSSRPQP